jgi:ribonuclease-3 family protein
LADFLPLLPEAISEKDAYTTGPLVLAFIGDAVQQLYVRTRLVVSTDYKSGELHKLAITEISAVSQSDTVERLMPYFTEAEADIYRRARNSKVNTAAKNASLAYYKKATGFEAVLGYLYLSGKHDRLLELLSMSQKEIK